MPAFICTACGTQYPPSEAPPSACLICTDERQFVPASGQSWTTLEGLRNAHSNKFRRLATGLTTIETTPAFGIGQRAILARTPAGNVLWECLALIDDATVDLLKGLGGVAAIAISHPHYYTTMVEWSRALGGVPIHLHAADRQWVMRPDPAVQFWEGDTKPIGPGLTLVRLGGHFDGGTVLHWADWSEGRGVLLSGDILQVVPSGHVSFMWSYPNLIPLSAAKVRRMAEILEPFAFDAVYGSFSGRGQIDANGKQVVAAVGRALHRADQRDIVGASGDWSHHRCKRAGCVAAHDPRTTSAPSRRSAKAHRGSCACCCTRASRSRRRTQMPSSIIHCRSVSTPSHKPRHSASFSVASACRIGVGRHDGMVMTLMVQTALVSLRRDAISDAGAGLRADGDFWISSATP